MAPTNSQDKVQVLYVGGVPRSGSTLGDLLFDKLDGHIAVGELFYLFENGLRLDNLCGCGQPFSSCQFWQSVGDVSFGGWSTIDPGWILRLQSRVDRTRSIPAIVSPWRTESFARDLSEYREILTRLYRGITKVSEARVVIDSSKRPSLAYVLQGTDDIELSCVHVVRDPRGVAYSFSKVVTLAPSTDAGPHMPRSKPYTVGRRWVTVNALIRALRHFGVNSLTMRYEDLAINPLAQLSRVAELQDQHAADIDDGCITPDGLRMARAHLVAGSRVRFVDGFMPIRLDEEWRSAMPRRQQRLVGGMTIMSRARYGYM